MIDCEITSNRCNHNWLCIRSLDGDTLKLQNGGHPSDVAQYILVMQLLHVTMIRDEMVIG